MKIILTRPIYIGRPIRFDRQELSAEHLAKYGYFSPILTEKGEPAVIPAGTEIVRVDGTEFNSYEEARYAVFEDDEAMFDFKGLAPEIEKALNAPSAPIIDFESIAIEVYNPRYYGKNTSDKKYTVIYPTRFEG